MNPSVQFYYSVQGAVERCCPAWLCFPPPPSLLVKERGKIKLLAAIGTFPALGAAARVAAWFIGSLDSVLPWKGSEKLTGSTFSASKGFSKGNI